MNEQNTSRAMVYGVLIVALMALWIPRLANQETNKLNEMIWMRDLLPVEHKWHDPADKFIGSSFFTIDPKNYPKNLKVTYPLSIITGDVQIDGKVTLRGYEIIPQIPSEPKGFMLINPRKVYP